MLMLPDADAAAWMQALHIRQCVYQDDADYLQVLHLERQAKESGYSLLA